MITDLSVGDFPESIQEGTLARWHKKVGDRVAGGEKVADVETDKIVLEIFASADGVVSKILKKEGDTIRRREAIAEIDSEGAAAAPAPAAKPAPVAAPLPRAAEPATPAPAPTPPASPAPAPRPPPPPPAPADPITELLDDLPPAARRLVLEKRINPKDITGTGRGGRITKADVMRFLKHSPYVTAHYGSDMGSLPVAAAPSEAAPAPSAAAAGRPEQRVKMTRLRARIAERLVQAQRSSAILTTFNEVNMHAVMQLRSRYKDQFEKEYGVKLGFMSFFVKAAMEALKKYPIINASVDGDDIVYHGYFDIGIAVSTSRGLVVPILRDVENLSLAEIETAIADFSKRGEEGKLTMDELMGGTFTISNGGVFGSLLSTPILNPPQSAILGMHRIQQRPVADNDQVVIRPIMYIALSYDHRIIDGRDAVLFLVSIKDALEDPTRLLLQI